MENKFLKRLGISVCISSMILGSSAMANTINQKPENQNRIVNNDISLFTIYHGLQNHTVDSQTSFPTTLTLSTGTSYGKVFYNNNSSNGVTITVTDKNGYMVDRKSTTGKSLEIKWQGNGLYSISIDSNGGGENLNGKVSTAISDMPFS